MTISITLYSLRLKVCEFWVDWTRPFTFKFNMFSVSSFNVGSIVSQYIQFIISDNTKQTNKGKVSKLGTNFSCQITNPQNKLMPQYYQAWGAFDWPSTLPPTLKDDCWGHSWHINEPYIACLMS